MDAQAERRVVDQAAERLCEFLQDEDWIEALDEAILDSLDRSKLVAYNLLDDQAQQKWLVAQRYDAWLRVCGRAREIVTEMRAEDELMNPPKDEATAH